MLYAIITSGILADEFVPGYVVRRCLKSRKETFYAFVNVFLCFFRKTNKKNSFIPLPNPQEFQAILLLASPLLLFNHGQPNRHFRMSAIAPCIIRNQCQFNFFFRVFRHFFVQPVFPISIIHFFCRCF